VTPCIQTTSLTKTYGETRAVVDLDLRVEPARVFGFLGPNGAGKTTTIRMLLALQRPTSGSASILGLDSQRDSIEIHRRIGYLPGELELYPRMTGKQHLDWFAEARGTRNRSYAEQLVERFGVVVDRPARELSTGNRQKIGLVLAFMHKPELLVLDEPTTGLDPLMQNEFEKLARETVAEGRTVFLSSHELDEVQRLADDVGIIRSGHLVATDTVEGLRKNAPTRIEAWFPHHVDESLFAPFPGVSVVASDGAHVGLEVAGPIGPVLRAIADQDPVDVISRHADLEELFLQFYEESPSEEGSGAR
jgi:ABC-2 type transport system ATP-binding protein